MAQGTEGTLHISVPLGEIEAPARPAWLAASRQRLAAIWHRCALLLVLGLAGCLECSGLGSEGYANTYYAAGIKSMLTSWHNFFFVSFDAGGFVSLDKPPLGLWIEAASARLFGFSGVSILAPEAVAGVASVALLYHLVARTFGPVSGLIAALALAVTPISAIIERNNTIDSLLVLTLLLGAWAVSLAAERGSLRLLLLTAVILGLAFNIKTLQAYLVVPAYALVYLLGARRSWRARLGHLALAGAVLLVVSFSWIALVDATPASQRPFVSDSGTNSELSLALGYNGLGRLTQALFPGVSRITIFGDPIDLTIVPAFAPEIGDPGPLRLISATLGGQASWFLLPALAGLIALASARRPRLPLGRRGQSLAVWGGWLLAAGFFFSTGRFFHLYYLMMIAPPIAALAGIGIPALWRDYRRSLDQGWLAGWRGWLLPITLVGTALLQMRFLGGYPSWSFWLTVALVAGMLAGALALVGARLRLAIELAPGSYLRFTPAVALGGVALSLIALLAAPMSWTVASIASGAGAAWLPQAGPSGGAGFGGGRGGGFGQGPRGGFRFSGGGSESFSGGQGGSQAGSFQRGVPLGGQATGAASGGPQGGFGAGGGAGGFSGTGGFASGRGGAGFGPGMGGSGFGFGGGNGASTFAGSQVPTLDAKLLSYLKKNQGHARYLVATATSSYASLFILQTNQPAMALGGYQGWDRILTLPRLKQFVANGTIRFFYLSPTRSTGGARARSFGGFGPGRGTTQAAGDDANVNNDLTSWVESACAAVPATRWQAAAATTTRTSAARGFGATGGLQLYDCVGHATRTTTI